MQDSPPSLTYNGILYLTLGFKQHYLLQVLSLQQHQKDLQLVLYDGLVYIGALYRLPSIALRSLNHPQSQRSSLCQSPKQVRMFDVVKIYPNSVCPNEPIVLQTLEVVASNLSCQLGKQIITLEEFMRRRRFVKKAATEDQDDEDEQVISPHSRKIAKLIDQASFEKSNTKESEVKSEHLIIFQEKMNEEDAIVVEDSFPEGEVVGLDQRETQRMVNQSNNARSHTQETIPLEQQPMISQRQSMEKEEVIQEAPIIDETMTLKNQRQQEKPSIVLDIQDQEFTLNNKSNIVITNQSPCSTFTPKQSKPPKQDSILRISDLYQRMHRFRILCRINYLTQFTSQKGKFCTKLILIDEIGDEIICMLYQKTPPIKDITQPKLIKGKSYIFENGEVTNEEGELSISVPWNGVIQQHLFLPSFVPSKMKRLRDVKGHKSSNELMKNAINLEERPSSKKDLVVNVCGIFQGFKDEPKTVKNSFRVVCILCDPNQLLSMQFSLYVDELASFPSPGSAVSLHNMLINEDEYTMTLEGNKKSYILNEAGNTHRYFEDLLKASEGDWKLHEYQNLSLVTYKARTISELKQLLSKAGQHEYLYSQIDCSISSIREKRSYAACITCKKEVKAQSNPFSYCYHCKKTNKYTTSFSFDIELSDPTGSFTTVLFSDELQGFIGMTAEQYGGNSAQDRLYFLDLNIYKNIIVKVKSERFVGGTVHKPISACMANHKRPLDQIRSITIEQKTKYINPW